MPTYQYRCTNCGKEFEELQKFSDPPIDTCPFCGGKPERLISGGVGVIFKGTGFYQTDYKNSSTSSGSASKTKSDTKSETKSDTKSDSKPEAKKESKPTESKPSNSSSSPSDNS